MLVAIDDIKVHKRIRKDTGDLDSLQDSLRRYGLLNPITLNARNELIAGGRRLEAAKALGWKNIDAVVLSTTDEATQLELELEENTQRLNFSDEDLVAGYHKLQRLKNPNFFGMLRNLFRRFFAWLAGVFSRKR